MGSFTDVATLRKAKELIDSPEKWCQEWFAEDAKGMACSTMSDEAVAFCAQGAIYKALNISAYANPTRAVTDPMHYLESTTPTVVTEDDRGGEVHVNIPIQVYNDDENRTHAEIMEWFDRAAKMAMPR